MSFLNAYRYYLSAASFFGVAPYSYDGRDFRLNRPNQIINIIYIILTTLAFIFPLTGWGVQANSLTPTQIIGFSLIIHSTDFATHLYQLVIPISIFVHRHKIISHMNRLNSQRLMAEEPKLGYFFQSKRNFRISFGAQVFLIAIVNIAAYPPIETISELFRLLSSIFFGYMVIAALSHFFIFLHMACEAYRRMSTELRKRVISWRLIEEQAKFDIVVKDFIEMVNEVFGPILIAFFWVCLINTAQVEVYAVDSGVFSEQATRSYFAALNPFLFGIVVIRKFRLVVYAEEDFVQDLHTVGRESENQLIREKIEVFSLQLLHRKVEFNICGFFQLDYSLIYQVVGTVTTIIAILLQFQSMQSSTEHCLPENSTCLPCFPGN